MLSRRFMLGGAAWLALPRAAFAERDTAGIELALLSADTEPASIQRAVSLVARLGAESSHIHMEAAHDVADAVARLFDHKLAVAAILPSTALAALRRSSSLNQIVLATRLIGQLEVLFVQLLASRSILDVSQLAGLPVNLGPRGSANEVTASLLLDRAGLDVQRLYLDQDQALAAVLQHQIAATVTLTPKAAQMFGSVTAADNVHFLPVYNPGGSPAGLFPIRIMPQDYAFTRELQEPVDSLGVPLVLGCFNWASTTNQFAALTRLAGLLADRGSGLVGFDMAAPVLGWPRFDPAAARSAVGQPGPAERHPVAPKRATEPQSKPADPPRAPPKNVETSQDRDQLFQQFLQWRQQR